MKNVNNLQEVWYSVDYSLILQAKFAERVNEETLSVHSITLWELVLIDFILVSQEAVIRNWNVNFKTAIMI